jgi:ribulose-5-phosphate 4-epimerase/fuculose-1-phosphate aldolase
MDDMTSSPYPPFSGVEPYGTVRSVADERAHRKRMCALGYRIFGAMRWGMLGDGHISARDPELTDHFWLLDWGVPFAERRLVLVGPGGEVKNAGGNATGAVNTAGYNVHHPLLAARPDVVSASHTHTAIGTPWSANVEPFRAPSQEACAFVFDQALFNDEEVEVLSIDGGNRIA